MWLDGKRIPPLHALAHRREIFAGGVVAIRGTDVNARRSAALPASASRCREAPVAGRKLCHGVCVGPQPF